MSATTLTLERPEAFDEGKALDRIRNLWHLGILPDRGEDGPLSWTTEFSVQYDSYDPDLAVERRTRTLTVYRREEDSSQMDPVDEMWRYEGHCEDPE